MTAARCASTMSAKTVRLSGWVHRKRDHGNLLFIDLRDHYGITQIVLDVSSPIFAVAEGLSNESVIRVDGKVVRRSDDTVNAKQPSGATAGYVGSALHG